LFKIKKSCRKAGLNYFNRALSALPEGFISYRRVRWKLSVYDVLSFCGWPIPYGHWRFAYAGEIREQIFYDVCAVDTFFFYLALFKFFSFYKLNFRIHFCYTQQGTIPVVCERTAKVGEIFDFRL
jgi:hypothetical protein